MKLSRSRFYAICVFFISVQVHFSIWFFFLVDFTLCVRIQFASEKCVHRHTNISVKQSTKARLLFSFLTFTSEYVFFFERNSFANRCAIRSTNWCFVHFDLVLCFRNFKFDTPVRGTYCQFQWNHTFIDSHLFFPFFCGLLIFCPFALFFRENYLCYAFWCTNCRRNVYWFHLIWLSLAHKWNTQWQNQN